MNKPIVFISHITEEKELAMLLKDLITKSFLDMIEVFVSSDDNSISSGSKWLQDITQSLSSCSLELILCSPKSIKRPWINFEAGAGWIREIPVIPLCHSGMVPNELPIPLNMLQGTELNSVISMNRILPVIANSLGSSIPNVDFNKFTEKVIEFEQKYTFDTEIIATANKLKNIDNELYEALLNKNTYVNEYVESDLVEIQKVCKWMIKNKLIEIHQLGSKTIISKQNVNGVIKNNGGTFVELEFRIEKKVNEILSTQ